MKIYVSHASGYDYENELYAPLKASNITREHQVLFPHDKENVDINLKEPIAQADLVVAEVSNPSTGQGIELGRAESTNTPVLCMYKVGSKPSSSLRFISKEFIEYNDQNDMLSKLEAWLAARK